MEERFSDEDSDGTHSNDEDKPDNKPVALTQSANKKNSSPHSAQRPAEGAFARVSRILFSSVSTPARRDIQDSSSGTSSSDDESSGEEA
jgi:hypothetical protein